MQWKTTRELRTEVVGQRLSVLHVLKLIANINYGAVGYDERSKVNFTPAALEEPSEYLDTAIMEMMKKIMEAVTHLMKSFERKERNTMIQRKQIKLYIFFF